MLPIVSASQRTKTQGIKGQVWGGKGIGKTSLLYTLPEDTTFLFDLEAGTLAVRTWGGDSIEPRTWEELRDITVWVCGPNRARRPDQTYSQAHYDYVCQERGGPFPAKYETVFIDSTTVASRWCFSWATGQKEAFSDKTGAPNLLGAYGLLGREMYEWISQFQYAAGLNVWIVGGLKEKEDARGRKGWQPMVEGQSAAEAIPYVLDEVITMAGVDFGDGTETRCFVCHTLNPYGYPAKTRGGLDMLEPPHLGDIMAKIRMARPKTAADLTYALPDAGSAPTPTVTEGAN